MSKITNVLSAMGIRKPAQVAKTAKSAVATAAKEAPKASGAEAMANQGRAMVKYTKPEVEVVKMESAKTNRATSDYWDQPEW